MKRLLLRGLVNGIAEGRLLVVNEPISFYGDVDRRTGVLKSRGVSVAGRILAAPAHRGSTVGAYILYALARRGLAPAGLIIEKPDTVIVAGAVLAGVPLAAGPWSELRGLNEWECRLEVRRPTASLSCAPPSRGAD